MALKDDVKLIRNYSDWTYVNGTCGHCGLPTHFALIGQCTLIDESSRADQGILVCSGCQGINIAINFLYAGQQWIPAPLPGREIVGLSKEVEAAWKEARAALGASAPTACEHMCRKILIHVSAEHNPPKQKMTFQEAVQHLLDAGVITAQWEPWVSQIRLNANAAAHELDPVTRERAEHTLEFTQQLLQLVYETRHRMRRFEKGKE